jgi:hypothetical protein
MPHPTDRNRYPEVQEYLNRALDSERGIRIEVPSKGIGFNLQMKIRAKQKDWKKIYLEMYEHDPENLARFRDPYQLLQPSVQQDPASGKWYVYIHKDNPFASGIVLSLEDL